jgi:hypothetical protein
MVDLRELIARAACSDCEGAAFINSTPDSTTNEYRWQDYLSTADAILAALYAAGLVVVPREPTEEMIAAFSDSIQFWMEECGEDADVYRSMLAASPYAKKEVE